MIWAGDIQNEKKHHKNAIKVVHTTHDQHFKSSEAIQQLNLSHYSPKTYLSLKLRLFVNESVDAVHKNKVTCSQIRPIPEFTISQMKISCDF